MQETLFSTYKQKTRVNVETDMFARYIDHILQTRQKTTPLTWNDVDKISALW